MSDPEGASPPQQQQQQDEEARSPAGESAQSPPGPSRSSSSPAPPPAFEPLFTLVDNATTNTTIHPRVHYIFSDDDDASMLRAAPSRSLIVDLSGPSSRPGGEEGGEPWAVSHASSLSGDFAVTATSLARQGGETPMLRIEGVEREPVEVRPESLPGSQSGVVGREDVEGLVDDFRRRMGVLRTVVGEADRRTAALEEGAEEGEGDCEGEGHRLIDT